MEIRTTSLDPELTVAEIDSGTADAWHFLPFEDRRAELFALDERYILALGRVGSLSSSAAIFDIVERRRTNIETNALLQTGTSWGEPHPWCYAPAHRSVFLVESERKPDGQYPNRHSGLRQLSVDGAVNRRILIAPDFHASVVVPRDDGMIVCAGLNRVAVLDPTSGEARVSETDRIQWSLERRANVLRWFSPDGRRALRLHTGSVIRVGGDSPVREKRGFLSRILPGGARAEPPPDGSEAHPDLAADGVRRFGLAVELFRLDPFEFERRLVLRYYTPAELFGAPEPNDEATFLDPLADQLDHRLWNGRDLALPPAPPNAESPMKALGRIVDRIERLDWDADSHGFTVALADGTREVQAPHYAVRFMVKVTDLAVRHVSLDGAVGPIRFVRGELKPDKLLPSRTACESILKQVGDRSSHRIDCAGWTGAEIAATLKEMRRRIEQDGLERLVFGEQLQFRFRVGGKTIGEKRFFDTVRKLPPDEAEQILPELHSLLRSYGAAARALYTRTFAPIASGPGHLAPAALSEAALTLAMLDDGPGLDALRDWVAAVDQEHDPFAAARIFPAVAKRTKFANAPALRFGLFFFAQQWQTVRYEKSWLGLFKAAPAVMTPEAFAAAVLAAARDAAGISGACSVEGVLEQAIEMLGRTAWDKAAAAELERRLAGLEAGGED